MRMIGKMMMERGMRKMKKVKMRMKTIMMKFQRASQIRNERSKNLQAPHQNQRKVNDPS